MKHWKIFTKLTFPEAKNLEATRYSDGSILLNQESEQSNQVKQFITDHRFLELENDNNVPTRNQQHKVSSFRLDGTEQDVIMKLFWVNPAYPIGRRIQKWFSHKFQDHCYWSFITAVAMRSLDIETFRPLAYWTHKKSALMTDKYLLYEKIPADTTLRDFLNEMGDNPSQADLETAGRLIKKAARLIAKMHRNNMIHGDIASGNFLVNTADDAVTVVDTDCVTRNLGLLPFFKRLKDIYSMRSLTLNEAQRRLFLKEYMGATFTERWCKFMHYVYHSKRNQYKEAYAALFSN